MSRLFKAMSFAALTFVASNASAGLIGTVNTNLQIRDNFTTSSTINGADVGSISKLVVTIALNHTFVGDLLFILSHGGRDVVLMAYPGDGANLVSTVPIRFSDDMTLPNARTIGGDCTQVGDATCPAVAFRSEQSLSVFDGLSGVGLWTLRVTDSAIADSGNLSSWSLTTADVSEVPEPATLILTLAGLAGIGLARRRTRH